MMMKVMIMTLITGNYKWVYTNELILNYDDDDDKFMMARITTVTKNHNGNDYEDILPHVYGDDKK